MSTQTRTRPTPDQLAAAIEEMAMRYGRAERLWANESTRRALGQAYDRADLDRQDRACGRRFRAIQRLAEALRQQADA